MFSPRIEELQKIQTEGLVCLSYDTLKHLRNLKSNVCDCQLLLLSRSVVSDSVRPHRWQPTRLPSPWDSPGKNTGVGCHFLLQCKKVKVKSLSRIRLLSTLWTAAHQAPPSTGFSRQEYWSGVDCQHKVVKQADQNIFKN